MTKKNKFNFFKKTLNFIDKKIIVPITKLVVNMTKKVERPSKWLENWLSKSNTLLFISLILAVSVFIVIDRKIIVFQQSSAEVLKKQTVKAIYNEEKYVIKGIPETVDITLIGSKADLYIAKQSPTSDVYIDLSNIKDEGDYKVNINYNNVSSSIEHSVNPSFATVVVYKKISQSKALTVDVINQDSLSDKLSISNVSVDTQEVVIKGAKVDLNKVASVKALVDLNNLPKQEAGTYTLKDVVLRAYDEKGNVVDVEIVPTTVNANVTISSFSKILNVKLVPKGEIPFGKAISSIESDVKEVTVYGTEEELMKLEYLEVEVDVSKSKTDFNDKIELVKPNGVKSMSNTVINVSVNYGNVSEKDFENINIQTKNLSSEFMAQAVSENDSKVTVNVKGVESVLNNIALTDISAYVDLSGLGEGVHTVEVQVTGNDSRVSYLSRTKTVQIRIRRNG